MSAVQASAVTAAVGAGRPRRVPLLIGLAILAMMLLEKKDGIKNPPSRDVVG